MADMTHIKTDEICNDPQIAYFKQQQMRKIKTHSFLQGVSETFKYIAGVLTTVGMAVALPAFVAATTATGGTVAAGLAAIPGFGWALLGVAAATTVIAVASYYAGANLWGDSLINNAEISAKSTAHHLVQEIEAHNGYVTQNIERADGKTWCQVAAESKAAQRTQSL